MGTKYIIEVEDKPFELLSEDGFTSEKLFRVKGFNSLVFDWNGLNKLTPYTEPDLEQVRKEAYDEGYDDAKGGYENGFENGMIVAWEAARKISTTPVGELKKILDIEEDSNGMLWPFHEYTAAEVIEKLKAYEQEHEEIKVGDEVERILNGEVDSKAVFLEDDEGYYCCLFWTGCCFTILSYPKEQFRKTGRHFDEIATILEKMRGEQDE